MTETGVSGGAEEQVGAPCGDPGPRAARSPSTEAHSVLPPPAGKATNPGDLGHSTHLAPRVTNA